MTIYEGMKKWLSLALAGALAAAPLGLVTARADEDLPFALTAPENVSAVWLEGIDSPTTIQFAYSLPNEVTTFYSNKDKAEADGTIEEFMAKYPFTDIWTVLQIDWAVDDVDDSVSGWHYNTYWDAPTEYYNVGYDDDANYRVGPWDGVELPIGNTTETVNELWIMRGITEEDFNGNPDTKTPGLKDQLRPEQYTYDKEEGIRIDYSEHTVYLRARYAYLTRTEEKDTYHFSGWSDTIAVGKEGKAYTPLTDKDLEAPVITDLKKTDKTFNGCPVVAYTLSVSETLSENVTKVSAAGGGIYIDTFARVKGDTEWTLMSNTDWTIKSGEMECALVTLVSDAHPTIAKDTPIELKCRYRCEQKDLETVYSADSEVISFDTDEIDPGTAPVVVETKNASEKETEAVTEPAAKKCPICHFCPQPLGLCIFIWIAIIIVVVVVVIVITKSRKKDEKGK